MISVAPTPARVAQLVGELRHALLETGSVSASVDALDVPVDVWRKAARRVGRELDRPVRTVAGQGWVHAVLADWPATEAETLVHEAAVRRAVNAVAAAFGNGHGGAVGL